MLNLPVSFEDAGNFWDQRVVRVWITEQRTDRQQHLKGENGDNYGEVDRDDGYLANCESRRPLGPQDVKADGSIGVDIWMIDSSGERHFGRLERIVSWEVNRQEEYSSLVRTIRWTHDGGLNSEKSINIKIYQKLKVLILKCMFLPANETDLPPLDQQSTELEGHGPGPATLC